MIGASLLFLALAAPAQAKPVHQLAAGVVVGVDFMDFGGPRYVAGLPYPLPSLRLAWSVEPEQRLPWIGLHTAPTFTPILASSASGDTVSTMVAPSLIMLDTGFDTLRTDSVALGPYVSGGLLALSAGVRLRVHKERGGVEVRAGWHAMRTASLAVSGVVDLTKRRRERPELPPR